MDPNAVDGMGTTSAYEITAVALSALALVLSVLYCGRVIQSYRHYHDERAAISLAKGIGLLVISLGLLISASGLLVGGAILSVAGLSLARGALIALLATLLLSDVRPSGWRPKDED